MGRKVQELKGHTAQVTAVALSPDGKQALTGAADQTAALWDAATGHRLPSLQGHPHWPLALAFSSDGARALIGLDKMAVSWEAGRGVKFLDFAGQGNVVDTVAITRDATRMLTGSFQQERPKFSSTLWDTVARRKVSAFTADIAKVVAMALSRDGKQLLTGSKDQIGALWDAETGRKLHVFKGHSHVVSAVAFSPDGKHVLTGSLDGTAMLWEADTGRMVRTFQGHTHMVSAVAYSPDGKHVLTRSFDRTAALWEADSGRKVQDFKGHTDRVLAVAFSPDGKYILTASYDKTAALWEADTGRRTRSFEGHTEWVYLVAFSPDGRYVLTSDGLVHLFDIGSGDELARLLSLDAGDIWLVTSPEGLFDGSLAGRERVAFRIGNGLNVVPAERFFQDLYRPGLLAELLGSKRPLPELTQSLQRAPIVRILRPVGDGTVEEPVVTVEVETADQGNGVRGPWLLHNGARVLAPGAAGRADRIVKKQFTVRLIQGDNRLVVQAASADGSTESEPVALTLRYERPLARPALYLVAVGVNHYQHGAMNLKFAADDASAFADLFRRRGKGGLYADVHTVPLLDDKATRMALGKALADIAKKAKPQDTVVVFIAGHGSTIGQR
jgi:WD40 repeat protein